MIQNVPNEICPDCGFGTVDTHMTRLRKMLGTVGEQIVTVWGVGYRFVG
jgi:DNA-binding response OmpR family regulator